MAAIWNNDVIITSYDDMTALPYRNLDSFITIALIYVLR